MAAATRADCIREAGEVWACARATMQAMTPREQAEAAWLPSGPDTVDEIEDRIRARRGLPPITRAA